MRLAEESYTTKLLKIGTIQNHVGKRQRDECLYKGPVPLQGDIKVEGNITAWNSTWVVWGMNHILGTQALWSNTGGMSPLSWLKTNGTESRDVRNLDVRNLPFTTETA